MMGTARLVPAMRDCTVVRMSRFMFENGTQCPLEHLMKIYLIQLVKAETRNTTDGSFVVPMFKRND
jgi:hypothetical protein